MSAYIVDRETIQFLVTAATARSVVGDRTLHWYWNIDRAKGTHQSASLHAGDAKRAAEVGHMLWQENVRSVQARYPGEKDLPGPVDEVFEYAEHRAWRGKIDPVQVLKTAHCLEYQSCEHAEWEASEAHAFLEALCRSAVHHLPGYDAAAWGAPSRMGVVR